MPELAEDWLLMHQLRHFCDLYPRLQNEMMTGFCSHGNWMVRRLPAQQSLCSSLKRLGSMSYIVRHLSNSEVSVSELDFTSSSRYQIYTTQVMGIANCSEKPGLSYFTYKPATVERGTICSTHFIITAISAEKIWWQIWVQQPSSSKSECMVCSWNSWTTDFSRESGIPFWLSDECQRSTRFVGEGWASC